MTYSLGVSLLSEVLSEGTQGCLRVAKLMGTPQARDQMRWSCHTQYAAENNSPVKCQQVAKEFETQTVTGVDWSCLTHFTTQIHLGACLQAAERNADPENSDDVRWYCWDQLFNQGQLSRSECLALASSMRIQGNRFKANWNCMNRLGKH